MFTRTDHPSQQCSQVLGLFETRCNRRRQSGALSVLRHRNKVMHIQALVRSAHRSHQLPPSHEHVCRCGQIVGGLAAPLYAARGGRVGGLFRGASAIPGGVHGPWTHRASLPPPKAPSAASPRGGGGPVRPWGFQPLRLHPGDRQMMMLTQIRSSSRQLRSGHRSLPAGPARGHFMSELASAGWMKGGGRAVCSPPADWCLWLGQSSQCRPQQCRSRSWRPWLPVPPWPSARPSRPPLALQLPAPTSPAPSPSGQ